MTRLRRCPQRSSFSSPPAATDSTAVQLFPSSTFLSRFWRPSSPFSTASYASSRSMRTQCELMNSSDAHIPVAWTSGAVFEENFFRGAPNFRGTRAVTPSLFHAALRNNRHWHLGLILHIFSSHFTTYFHAFAAALLTFCSFPSCLCPHSSQLALLVAPSNPIILLTTAIQTKWSCCLHHVS